MALEGKNPDASEEVKVVMMTLSDLCEEFTQCEFANESGNSLCNAGCYGMKFDVTFLGDKLGQTLRDYIAPLAYNGSYIRVFYIENEGSVCVYSALKFVRQTIPVSVPRKLNIPPAWSSGSPDRTSPPDMSGYRKAVSSVWPYAKKKK